MKRLDNVSFLEHFVNIVLKQAWKEQCELENGFRFM